VVVSLFVAGLVLASLPALVRRLGLRIPVREWAALCLIALIGAAALVESALIAWATPAVFDAIGLHDLAESCTSMLGLVAVIGWPGSAFAFSVAIILPVLAVRNARRLRDRAHSLQIEAELGEHDQRGDVEIVLLPTAAPLAYSVDGPDPQIVLSTGLVASLADDQLAAVVAHERAHLRHEHGRWLRAAAVAASTLQWWPPAHRSHRILRAAIERWADETASRGDANARHALRSALIEVIMADPPIAVPALSLASTTVERVNALDGVAPLPRVTRISLYIPGGATAVVVGMTIASCLASIPAWETIRACCSI
jgi:Zn-dependent protease with chaperone function